MSAQMFKLVLYYKWYCKASNHLFAVENDCRVRNKYCVNAFTSLVNVTVKIFDN